MQEKGSKEIRGKGGLPCFIEDLGVSSTVRAPAPLRSTRSLGLLVLSLCAGAPAQIGQGSSFLSNFCECSLSP